MKVGHFLKQSEHNSVRNLKNVYTDKCCSYHVLSSVAMLVIIIIISMINY